MLRNFPGPPNFVRPSLLSSVNALASSVSASVKDDTDAIVVSPFFSQKAHAANNLIRYSLDPCTASAHSCWLTTFGSSTVLLAQVALVDGDVHRTTHGQFRLGTGAGLATMEGAAVLLDYRANTKCEAVRL